MKYEEQLRQEQVEAYLAKLELTGHIPKNLEGLNTLLFAQLIHIPFDSLDVWGAGICPSLVLDDIYEKTVERGRGGYCFELNTLFRALLNALGFEAYQAAAVVTKSDDVFMPPTHNVILCPLEGKIYFLDVGFGGPVPYRALELTEGQQGEFSLKYEGENIYTLHRLVEGQWRCQFRFRNVPVTVSELIPLNFYVSQKPDSHFRHLIHLNRRNPDGSIYALDGKEFKIFTPEGTIVRQLQTIDEVKEILRSYYSIDPAAVPLRDSL